MEGSEVIVHKMHSEVCMRIVEQSRAKAVKIINDCIEASKLLLSYMNSSVLRK